jgi:hypothetical protein
MGTATSWILGSSQNLGWNPASGVTLNNYDRQCFDQKLHIISDQSTAHSGAALGSSVETSKYSEQ